MCSSTDYSEFAEECLDWARTAKSPKERAIFLQMTRVWLEAAAAQAAEAPDQTPQAEANRPIGY
jgi:hypothetical protein